jgi:hypothetical protein
MVSVEDYLRNREGKKNVYLDRHTRKPANFEKLDTDAISPVSDLDLAFVNRVLYSSDKK